MSTATSGLLRSALDLRLSEVSFTPDRLVVRSAPGPTRRLLAAVLALPFLSMAVGALRHPDAVMLVLALVLGAVSLPFVALVGAAVHEKTFSRRDGLGNSLSVLGWSTAERAPVPPGASIVVRAATRKGGRRFTVSVTGRDGMAVSVLDDQAAALELARRLAVLLEVPMDDATAAGS